MLLSRKSVQQGVCKLRLGFGKHDACRGLVLKDRRESFEPSLSYEAELSSFLLPFSSCRQTDADDADDAAADDADDGDDDDDHDRNTGMIQVDMPCLAALGNKFMTGDSGRAPPFFGGKWTDEMINEAKIRQNMPN